MNKLGIIIINYNSPDDTLACIQSVEKNAKDLDPTLLVFDNSESYPLKKSQFSKINLDIHFSKNSKNLGFAGAVNQGLKILVEEEFDYFFLLNNDVVLVDDSLHRMVDCLNNEVSVNIIGGINYFFKQPDKIWQAGFKNNWMSGSVSQIIPKQSYQGVDYVPGSTLLGRMEVVNKIGCFDEQFFHYFEENDFCVRVEKSGGKVVVLSGTRFLHKADGRDRKDSPFIFYYMTRNQLFFITKHRSVLQRIIPFVWLHFYNLLRAVKFDMITEKYVRFTFLKTYFKAISDFWRGNKAQNKNLFPQ